MEPNGSLQHSQVTATCPYPEPLRSGPYSHIPLPEDPSYNIRLCLGLPSERRVSFFLFFFLTPCSWVLLDKLTGLQLVKKFPAFYGTRRFITTFTSARRLSVSWASSIQSKPPNPTSWRSILILSSHLRLGLPSERNLTVCNIRSRIIWQSVQLR